MVAQRVFDEPMGAFSSAMLTIVVNRKVGEVLVMDRRCSTRRNAYNSLAECCNSLQVRSKKNRSHKAGNKEMVPEFVDRAETDAML